MMVSTTIRAFWRSPAGGTGNHRAPPFDPAFKYAKEGLQVRIEQSTHVAQFDRVDASHAPFDVADEGLAAAKPIRQRLLGHPRAGARLAEQSPQQIVFRTMDRLGHGRTWGSGQASYM